MQVFLAGATGVLGRRLIGLLRGGGQAARTAEGENRWSCACRECTQCTKLSSSRSLCKIVR